jgi:hypothetical protein
MTNKVKIVSILDNDNKIIGKLALDTACEIEGWDYDTTDFGLDFIPLDIDGNLRPVKRESRTDDNWNTTTFEWIVGEYLDRDIA